jgi:hypothetical protein
MAKPSLQNDGEEEVVMGGSKSHIWGSDRYEYAGWLLHRPKNCTSHAECHFSGRLGALIGPDKVSKELADLPQ